jgi:DNA-binding response OmpR family regulator
MLRALRATGNEVPVLILTGSSAEEDKELAFALGADDYLTKPVATRTLLACIKALLRRAWDDDRAGPSWVRIGDIAIHPPTRRVRRRNDLVELRLKEYELLAALLRQRGHAVSRADLLKEVWSHDLAYRTRTVDTTIASLRRKLEQNPRCPGIVLTVHGDGYMLSRQEAPPPGTVTCVPHGRRGSVAQPQSGE